MGRRNASALLGVVIALGGLAASARGQGETGFLRGEGQTDAALTYSYDVYDHFWVGNDRVEDPAVGEVTREALNLFIAHGLDDRTDIFMSASFVDAENDGFAPFDDETDLQDAIFGVKWQAWTTPLGPGAFSFLALPSVKIPMTHYEANSVTAIGDGQIDYRARGILHYRADCGAFVSVETGFDYRTEETSNEWPLNVTLGFTVFDRVTIMPFYSQLRSDGGPDIGQAPFPDTQEEWERWGVQLYGRITENIGVTLGWRETIDGKNTGDVTSYWGGVVFKF